MILLLFFLAQLFQFGFFQADSSPLSPNPILNPIIS